MATATVKKSTATVSKGNTGGSSSAKVSSSSGNRISSSTYKGVTTTNKYDSNNRLISSTKSNSAGTSGTNKDYMEALVREAAMAGQGNSFNNGNASQKEKNV